MTRKAAAAHPPILALVMWPRLSLSPFRESVNDLIVGNHPPSLNIGKPSIDLLANVDVVLDVLQRRVLGKNVEKFPHLIFRGIHPGIVRRIDERIFRMPSRNSGRAFRFARGQ